MGSDCHWIHSTPHFQSLSFEIVLEQLNIHRSRSHYDLEVSPLLQQPFYQPQDHIDTDRPLMRLVDHQTRILRQLLVRNKSYQ